MTGTAKHSGEDASRDRAQPRSYVRLVILILLIEALALGLKAWDDHANRRDTDMQIAQREAAAVVAHVSGRVHAVEQALRSSLPAEQTAELNSDIEAVISLADALSAGPGTRLNAAGEAASLAAARNLRAALSDTDDLIVVSGRDNRLSRFALLPPGSLLPADTPGYSFQLARQGESPDPPAGSRTVCTPMGQSGLDACVTSPQPGLGRAELLNLLIYALLLAGPAITMFGLLGFLNRRQAREQRLEAETVRAGRMLATVMRESRSGFWSINMDTRRVWLSGEAAELIGAPGGGEMPIAALEQLIHPDFQDRLRSALAGFARDGEIRVSLASRDQSRWFDMRGHPEGSGMEISGVLLDTTEVRTAIARSKRAEQRLQAALEGFSGPFALWDSRHRLVFWNRAFARIFNLESVLRPGLSHHTVALAQSASIVDRRPDRNEKGVEIIRVASGPWFQLVERETATGGMITIALDVSANVRIENELLAQRRQLQTLVSELERSRTQASDLAARLREEKVRAENSANSKSAFLANMSHELRTPLNAINGFSEILSNEMYGPLGDSRYREYARDILASGHHLLDMINDILDMAKIEAGKMTVDLRRIDLIDPVDAAIRMIRRKAEDKGLKLSLEAQDDLPLVDADHRAIRQMILNLVSNAIKFTDEGGAIRVRLDREGEDLRVTVEDTGIGIPAEALPRLAEPFEQVSDTRDRNYEGTGLGLALTKSFAEMHGGRLDITSREGEGTRISFYLPIQAGRQADSDAA